MDLNFSSKEELYERVKPALRTKKSELDKLGFSYISLQDIWAYLTENKWINGKDLMLSDIVDDILKVNNEEVNSYFKNMEDQSRKTLYFDNN